MGIKVANLTAEILGDAPEWDSYPFSCKYCVYWGFPEGRVDLTKETTESLVPKKLNWLRRTNELFGNCGKIAYLDGVAVGYAQYAPPRFLPGAAGYQAGPPSDDAALISCLFIPHSELMRAGLGKRLLESIIEDLRQRGVKAAETFARRGKPDNPSGPWEFYVANGFRVYRDDPEFPLLRLGP